MQRVMVHKTHSVSPVQAKRPVRLAAHVVADHRNEDDIDEEDHGGEQRGQNSRNGARSDAPRERPLPGRRWIMKSDETRARNAKPVATTVQAKKTLVHCAVHGGPCRTHTNRVQDEHGAGSFVDCACVQMEGTRTDLRQNVLVEVIANLGLGTRRRGVNVVAQNRDIDWRDAIASSAEPCTPGCRV